MSLPLPAYAAGQVAPAGKASTSQVALSAIQIENFGKVDAA